MHRQTKRLLLCAALMLAAIVIAGAASDARPRPETQQASTSTVLAAGKDHPTVSYWHVWTDDKGVSRTSPVIGVSTCATWGGPSFFPLQFGWMQAAWEFQI
ncbi:MAG TPA: hypothetical protein VMR25_08655, partial [Planctomycetaceae bacterium]|nr:hypothetical protein [Planctomycetaceae bacterium]